MCYIKLSAYSTDKRVNILQDTSNIDGLDSVKHLTTSFVESGMRYYLYHVGSVVK